MASTPFHSALPVNVVMLPHLCPLVWSAERHSGHTAAKQFPFVHTKVVPSRVYLSDAQALASLPLWTSSAEGDFIVRSFVAKNFASAMKFLNRVATVAEEQVRRPLGPGKARGCCRFLSADTTQHNTPNQFSVNVLQGLNMAHCGICVRTQEAAQPI